MSHRMMIDYSGVLNANIGCRSEGQKLLRDGLLDPQ